MSRRLFDLTGKTAVVTGGNGGIGFAIAKGLAEAGASVVIVGRDEEKNRAAEARLRDTGSKALAIRADVTTEAGCASFVKTAIDHFGSISILVNNAGTNIRKRPEAYSLDEWRMLIDVNLTSVHLACMAIYPVMKGSGGKIVNIGSMTSIFGAPFSEPYGAAKGGVVQLTKALASAWASDGIQVNAILPGWIVTDLTIRGRTATPDLHEKVIARTPAGRWGEPEDLAGAAVFLASQASNFVTGVALPVDGGYAAQA
ncbi:MAG: glucose 1-dehydrogenase [Novosphingobium sp.]|uniref:SDR family NAD(P)-dependent oxidoreductase n=1 Tax=Novosphingobium sp. TaxID=1874826 RepID=UPI0022C52E69|nr:glucose 1-dehydrogenase [Novosphingobium sp.]MCZ8036366.1 glucose 1-dehydrogenase [Novosphingobium sp.]